MKLSIDENDLEYDSKKYKIMSCPVPRNEVPPAFRYTDLGSKDINSWGFPDFRPSLKGFTVLDLDVAIAQLDVRSGTIVLCLLYRHRVLMVSIEWNPATQGGSTTQTRKARLSWCC